MPIDTLYNRRLLDIIHNYNEVNAYATRLTNMSPELRIGSGRPREFILAEGHSPAWSGLDMFDRSLPIAVRGDMNESVGGVNRFKKANKWTGYALDTADKALGLATKYGAGEKPKVARFAKGSQEMKDKMAKLRAMRK